MPEDKKPDNGGFQKWQVSHAATGDRFVMADYMTLEQGCLCFWKFGASRAGTSTLSESFAPGAWETVRLLGN